MNRLLSIIILSIACGGFLLPQPAMAARPPAVRPATQPGTGLRFAVSAPPDRFSERFSGRVVIWLSKCAGEPRRGPNWSSPEPCYSAFFKDVLPGSDMVLDDSNCVGFPGKIADLPSGKWNVQAVIDRNLGGGMIGGSPGNLYSNAVEIELDPGRQNVVKLVCDHVVPPPTFIPTEFTTLVSVESKLLSDFYKRPTKIEASVTVPAGYGANPEKTFPSIYSIGGFGQSIYGRAPARPSPDRDGVSFLFIVLDANCPTGHSVFADSANNGPWGAALITELIPAIERQFRVIPGGKGRFVTGHSSGGWSSLWLQVTYPDEFNGCWSTAPDPVDFRDFQQIDIYAPGANVYVDQSGERRPLARRGGTPTIWFKDFIAMERPIRGEQIGSFEAVFGPRGDNGEPVPLIDRATGAVDPRVAEAWKRYDINLRLRDNWPALRGKLAGKIHVYTGDQDTYYLDGAVRLLKPTMLELQSDAVIEIVPGDHGSMMTPDLRRRIDHEIAERFRQTN